MSKLLTGFDEAVSDDLNTAKALTLLDDVIAASDAVPEQRLAAIGAFDRVLGLDLMTLTRADLRVRPADATIGEPEIAALLDKRLAARATKDYAAADAQRDALTSQGVDIMDGDPLRWEWRLDL